MFDEDIALPSRFALFVTIEEKCPVRLIYNALRSAGAEFVFLHQELTASRGTRDAGMNTPFFPINHGDDQFVDRLHQLEMRNNGGSVSI